MFGYPRKTTGASSLMTPGEILVPSLRLCHSHPQILGPSEDGRACVAPEVGIRGIFRLL